VLTSPTMNRDDSDCQPDLEQTPWAPHENDFHLVADLLEAVANDRALLAAIDPALRKRLLIAAGRVARPERAELRAMSKALRRSDHVARDSADEALLDATGIRNQARAPLFLTPAPSAAESPPVGESAGELREPRKCYVCKAEFRRVHFFYDQMCPACAEFNFGKRTQRADLRGRVALVTGARLKIGYQASILLLRSGARVLVTTRFPHDAALRYAREPDFEDFRDRLVIHALDLMHTPSVERFCDHMLAVEPRLDFVINNAAQTVRRPPAFYAHLFAVEAEAKRALPAPLQPIVGDSFVHEGGLMLPRSTDADALAFPEGKLDQDLQQVDLRALNSWRLTLGDVPTLELIEVHLVNAIAPFVLNSRLKPLLLKDRTMDKHIVNVSAMEAQFERAHKTDKHPHTNMAKAALNMMTRTSAIDYAADGIFMNSVDTGWVTDEDPMPLSVKKTEVHGFHPPLDSVDGAARVIDPIFTGLNTGQHAFGLFFKDYKPAPW